jgi:hypothetical protein
MLTEKEWDQIYTAIRHLKSPVSFGSDELCFKAHVIDILRGYKEKEWEET